MGKIFTTILLVVFCGLCCVSKSVQTEASVKKLMMPAPAALSSADSLRYIQTWNLGMHLFKNNCSSCHGIFGKQKDSVLNFSMIQFHNYKSGFLAGDSANHAVMAKMTQAELDAVFVFLIALKRN